MVPPDCHCPADCVAPGFLDETVPFDIAGCLQFCNSGIQGFALGDMAFLGLKGRREWPVTPAGRALFRHWRAYQQGEGTDAPWLADYSNRLRALRGP